MEIETLTAEEAAAAMAAKRQTGQYQPILNRVIGGEHVKITGLTTGQVASVYRIAKKLNVVYRTNYKDGEIVLSPPPASEE